MRKPKYTEILYMNFPESQANKKERGQISDLNQRGQISDLVFLLLEYTTSQVFY